MPHLPKRKRKKPIWVAKDKMFASVDTKEAKKFYNCKQWKATRKAYIVNNPFCEQCEKGGLLTDATGRKGVVDHIKPWQEGGSKFNTKNLQTLCNRCHYIKSGKEGARKTNEKRLNSE